ncbi:hypothetical protein [Legionella israelensis]|nr:hypothetical protein [Legionella israelensis]
MGIASIFLLMTFVTVVGVGAWVGNQKYQKYQHDKERDEIVEVVLKDYSE